MMVPSAMFAPAQEKQPVRMTHLSRDDDLRDLEGRKGITRMQRLVAIREQLQLAQTALMEAIVLAQSPIEPSRSELIKSTINTSSVATLKHSSTEYGVPMPEFDFNGMEVHDERTIKPSKVIPGEKFKFSYLYDFGDSWEHEILVEKVLKTDPSVHYPNCITDKCACPPEDCGGV